ncbi:Fic family protein [Proteocatella sphenisci]|uniref:Fic family protein n=1 Tax=Proteocatella sphenisci TaxID=181070 RepID=UPI002E8E2D48|nr:Fic family protein [Proteocatella sphenisci]
MKMKEFNYREINSDLMVAEIMNIVSKIHEYKGKQELFMKVKPDILKSMLEVAKIQSTGASNRIEGIFTSDARLEELVSKKAEPMNRDEEEIAGYREVLNTIHENYDYIAPRSNVILQLHRDLYSYHPSTNGGRFKNQDNIIEEVDENGTRRVRFKPLSAFETPEAVERLCSAYIEAINEDKIDPLILISKFVLDFLSIHPFNDGNGRMSRLMTLLLLYQQGYIVGKYISIEMIIEGTKESYYEALQESSLDWHKNENSYFPFVKYYLSILLKAYKEFSDRVETVAIDKMSKSERVKDLFDKKIGKLSKREIAEICPDISVTTIEKTLSDLVKDGYIKKVGSGRATAYVKIG